MNPENEIIKVASQLVEAGLLIRNWGSLSRKISPETFLITPEDLPFDKLNESLLKEVPLAKSFFTAQNKTSVMAKVHRAIYRHFPQVKAIVQTRQREALAASAARSSLPLRESAAHGLFSDPWIPVTPYARQGSRRQIKGIIQTLKKTQTNTLLLANHGLLVTGETIFDAAQRALGLEEAARLYLDSEFCRQTGLKTCSEEVMAQFFVRNMAGRFPYDETAFS